MNNMGGFLKFKRIEKDMTQNDLCRGICTTSYLSRIENNQVIANKQIYNLLFKKLGIDYESLQVKNSDINQRIESWYKDLLLNKTSEEDIEELRKISSIAGGTIGLKFEIVFCRYLLMKKNIREAGNILGKIDKSLLSKQDRVHFLYTNTLILYFYLDGNYSQAVKEALAIIDKSNSNLQGESYELGIFYYNLALCFKNIYLFDNARYYALQALDLFNKDYYLERSISCQILIGICNNNMGNFDKALDAYSMAKRILEYLPDDKQSTYLSILNNNLGYCFESKDEYNKAIDCYLESLKYEEESSGKMLTIINLIRCYYFLKNKEKTIFWHKKGIELKNENTSNEYLIQLEIFSILLSDNPSIEDIIKVETSSIKYFISNKLWKHTVRYCKIFGLIYEEYYFYKKVSKMYALALEANEKLLKGGNEL